MTSNEEKAQQLVTEAEKKLASSSGIFSLLFRRSDRAEDSIDCYQKAGNLFKMSKQWEEAGNTFCKAAGLQLERNWNYEAASNFVNAANCYKRISVDNAIDCFSKAINIYINIGRFIMVAKYFQAIAELYETTEPDLKFAIEYYEQAAEYFRVEDSNSSANRCLVKVAHYEAELENYEKAAKIYEEMVSTCLESSLLKYSAKEYLLRATLCHLCVDLLNAQHALDRYIKMHPAFLDQREYKFLKTLMEHIEEQDLDGFTKAVRDYDFVYRLDKWYTTILLRIKTKIFSSIDLR